MWSNVAGSVSALGHWQLRAVVMDWQIWALVSDVRDKWITYLCRYFGELAVSPGGVSVILSGRASLCQFCALVMYISYYIAKEDRHKTLPMQTATECSILIRRQHC